MNQDYLSCRSKAIKWIDDKKRPFKQGLAILQESGYKPVAVANVAKRGEENAFANAKLATLMYEFIRLWSKPEMAANDEKPEQEVKPEPEAKTEEEIKTLCDKQGYPDIIRRVIHEFYALMGERRQLQSKATAIEGNEPTQVAERKDLFETIESISLRMDFLWTIKTKFEKDKEVPSEDIFEVQKADTSTDGDDEEDDTIPENATVDDLKKLKKNVNTKLIRARNMLDYQQVTKADEPNPMPEGPKRAKYEKKVETLTAFIEKIGYKIVELS
ncbi:hypothetical protein [Parabacteroides provencensis]|uniref:hypothetical protein n=1 Tax=Parabacteroides provencensis TaxID=1944636 RepID=UPI000C14B2C1|nr:hypothetical protein [Parabacteroides provencensis]